VAIHSKQSGSWNAGSTWQGGVVPNSLTDVVIEAGHTVTRNTAFTAHSYLFINGTMVYQGNVARFFDPGFDIEIQGELRVEGGSLYADGIVYGNGTFKQTGGNTTFGRAYVVENNDIQAGTVIFQNTNNGNLFLDNLSLKNATVTVNGTKDLFIKVSMIWGNNGKFIGDMTVEDGATLTFPYGNFKFYHEGTLFNYGTVVTAAGSLTNISNLAYIYNYGLWKFDAPANSGFGVYHHNFYNHGEILKTNVGGASFESSCYVGGEPGSKIHVQQAGITLRTSNTTVQDGTWQVDAGCSMLVFGKDIYGYVPFGGPKIVNNGNIYGRLRMAGSSITTLEGNGKYDKMEIDKSGAQVTLAGSPEITEIITLTSGNIVLYQYDLRLGKADISYTSNFNSYIETNGTGSCVRFCPVGISTFYPIGNNAFTPFAVQLEAGSTADFVKARVADSFYGEYNGAGTPLCNDQVSIGVVGHNWFLSEQAAGGSIAFATAYWLTGAERNDFNRFNCTLGQYQNGDWKPGAFQVAEDLSPFFAAYRTNVNSFGLFGVFDAGHEGDVNFMAPTADANAPICEWKDLQLHVSTSPNAQIQWSGPNGFQSNNPDPIIPGIQLSQGGNYVVAASQYGCPEKQTSITIQVNAEPTATVLGPDHVQPGESATLTAYGGTSYLWSTGESTQSITVAPTQITDYVVTVSNASGCTVTVLHTVQTGATATHEAEGTLGQMKIAPNPASNATLLTFESATTGEAQLSIMDARGAQLFHQNTSINSGQNQINISLESLPAGTYQVTLIRDSEVKTIRLVKMRGE
ncbi:MAG: T9SS type A sorting domain-containing protein, partial [Phycisphaerae bacterium]|nr:T9SS type A sorting domain-containing protein [Saprospiraceae bacterium]